MFIGEIPTVLLIYHLFRFRRLFMNKMDLTGQRYGRLVVIKEAEPYFPSTYPKKPRCRQWLCKCDCGNKKVIMQTSLRTGNTKSCGCGCEENRKRILMKPGATRCKFPSEKRLRGILGNMKMRCYNPNTKYYENYGGRGIKICDEWLSKDGADNFCEWALNHGYKEGLTIDRINNDGNYEPSNCRWLCRTEQMSNTRNNVYFNYYGEMLTATQIARLRGCDSNILRWRLQHGWALETAINTPKKHYKKRR